MCKVNRFGSDLSGQIGLVRIESVWFGTLRPHVNARAYIFTMRAMH